MKSLISKTEQCLDLGSWACKYLALEKGVRVCSHSMKILKAPWDFEDLESFIKETGISGEVTLLLPSADIFVKLLDFESFPEDPDKAEKLISWVLRDQVGIENIQQALDWCVLAIEPRVDVMVLAIVWEKLTSIIEFLRKHGIIVNKCNMAESGILNGNLSGDGLEMLFHMGHQLTRAFTCLNGKPVYIRMIHIGGKDVTCSIDNPEVLSKSSNSFHSALKPVLHEIVGTVRFVEQRFAAQVSNIRFSGGGLSFPDMDSFVSRCIERPVRFASLPDGMDCSVIPESSRILFAPLAWALWEQHARTT